MGSYIFDLDFYHLQDLKTRYLINASYIGNVSTNLDW